MGKRALQNAIESRLVAACQGLSGTEQLDRIQRLLDAVWLRAEVPLGPLVLAAVAERVVKGVADRYRFLEALQVEKSGISARQLARQVATIEPASVTAAFSDLLTHFILCLNEISAGVLAPLLMTVLDEAFAGGEEGRMEPEPAQTIERVPTGIPNLDLITHGGLPKGSLVIVTGPPGTGKTILAQQICFHNVTPSQRALFVSTLSEPAAKSLQHMQSFDFFDLRRFTESIEVIDVGDVLRSQGLEATLQEIRGHLRRVEPAFLIIDSVKAFSALAPGSAELRRFDYELAIEALAWRGTAFFVGEYALEEYRSDPIFSIADGLIGLDQRFESGEQQRFIQVRKMRGTAHDMDAHSFTITQRGIEVFAPSLTIRRQSGPPGGGSGWIRTWHSDLDALLGRGIQKGSSVLISGASGTGKTLLLLAILYHGAKHAGEKGLFVTFEQGPEQLIPAARGLGWDLEAEIDRGLIDILFVPRSEVRVAANLQQIQMRAMAMGAQRIAVDSVSMFLNKVENPIAYQDKLFQLCTLAYNLGAAAFMAVDIPHGGRQVSRMEIEEHVVDGLIRLSLTEQDGRRDRYIEVVKLRNTAHLTGRHSLIIGPTGFRIFPRYILEPEPPSAIAFEPHERLSTGVPLLDTALAGGIFRNSVTLVSGSTGIGKSTLSLQFLLAGSREQEKGLFFTLEETPAQVIAMAEAMGLPLSEAIRQGWVEVVFLQREQNLASQLLAVTSDKILQSGARRLVIEGVRFISGEGVVEADVQSLLQSLGARFKRLNVTSIFTVDSESLFSLEFVTGLGLSPVTDNLIALRYSQREFGLQPTLTVIKTRGSHHLRNSFDFEIAQGVGIRPSQRLGIAAPEQEGEAA